MSLGSEKEVRKVMEQERGTEPEGSRVAVNIPGPHPEGTVAQFSHKSFIESLLFQTSLGQIRVSCLRASSLRSLG